jgi:hypothetical protein
LTATVTPGATGKVTFYDGVTILGIGTLSGGQASISTVMLPSGNGSLRAYYQGDGTYFGSSSATVPQTVVAETSLGLQPGTTYPRTDYTYAIATGDFNGDGKQDIVMASRVNGTVTVYLGNGDGTFQNGVDYPAENPCCTGIQPPWAITVGDFNGDGYMDLAVANGTLAVLLGNGDGTFQPAVNYSVYATALAVADLNGDGNADLVLANTSNSNLAILLGNGDGSFWNPIFVSASQVTVSVSVADFNGDGIPDLLIAPDSDVAIMLGNGDGTFQAPQTVPAGGAIAYYPVQTADFNGDGRADILVNSGESVTVLLGNGNGTFGSPLTYNVGGGELGRRHRRLQR